LADYQKIVFEKHEHFVKQSFRSRCIINTAQGAQTLTVPLTSKHGKTIISEVRIDYSQKWLNNHWRAIHSAYAKAPFFEYYADSLERILFKKHTLLFDLNHELLTMCLKWIKLNVQIEESLAYEALVSSSTKDLRNVFSPKIKPLGSDLPSLRPYTQVFGNAFVNNLSLIDLVFCTGPQALAYVKGQG
jgi:hypothetical protein